MNSRVKNAIKFRILNRAVERRRKMKGRRAHLLDGLKKDLDHQGKGKRLDLVHLNHN